MYSETLETIGDYRIVAAVDEAPLNPFAEWDSEPPIAALYDRRITPPLSGVFFV